MARKTYGALHDLVQFQPLVQVPDGSGGTVDGFDTGAGAITAPAAFIYQRGSETVEAARLEGRSIYKIRIAQSQEARTITTTWRMLDLRRGQAYNIREVDAITDRHWVYLIAESGVAV